MLQCFYCWECPTCGSLALIFDGRNSPFVSPIDRFIRKLSRVLKQPIITLKNLIIVVVPQAHHRVIINHIHGLVLVIKKISKPVQTKLISSATVARKTFAKNEMSKSDKELWFLLLDPIKSKPVNVHNTCFINLFLSFLASVRTPGNFAYNIGMAKDLSRVTSLICRNWLPSWCVCITLGFIMCTSSK